MFLQKKASDAVKKANDAARDAELVAQNREAEVRARRQSEMARQKKEEELLRERKQKRINEMKARARDAERKAKNMPRKGTSSNAKSAHKHNAKPVQKHDQLLLPEAFFPSSAKARLQPYKTAELVPGLATSGAVSYLNLQ